MKLKQILKRVNGFETPVGGFSWNPPEDEREVAKRIIAFLEDKRTLYYPYEFEIPTYCVDSVLEIRKFLTIEIGKLDDESKLKLCLKAMRASCRKFSDLVDGKLNGYKRDWIFNQALSELRAVFGIHITTIARMYALDVEDGLASILPPEDAE
jgi:hypothetical protein